MSDFDEQQLYSIKQRLEMRERQIEAVHRISAALYLKNDLDSLLRETLHVALETVEADAGSILLFEREKRKLVFHYVVGAKAAELMGGEIDPDDEHANAAAAFRSGQTVLTHDPRAGTYNPRIDRETGFKTKSLVTVPLKSLGGEPIGVMQALNKRHDHFGEEDKELLEIVGSLAATSIVNARLAEEAQLAAVARAVGDLGHDIKNAMTPIETMVDTTIESFIEPMYAEIDALAQSPPTDAQDVANATLSLRDWYPEMRVAVKDGCADIREMVSEIADYIKGAQSTYMEIGDAKTVIEERLRRLRVVAQNRRVTIYLEAGPDLPAFLFDRRLLGRAVFNLVNNALNAVNDAVKKKVMELRPGGFNVWVKVSAVVEGIFPVGNYCLIEILDDGPGIPARVKESLFTPKAISTTPGGTGIGTRFVKSVADAHGGEVGVESEPGCGARFWLKLPLNQEKE